MTTNSNNTLKCHTLIVGAGMAGLAASSVLASANQTVIVLEKSRGLGGRCSTKRGSNYLADTGAQFFKKTLSYWDFIPDSKTSELRAVELSGAQHSRFIHPQGMSKVARFFESSKNVLTAKRVVAIKYLQAESCYEVCCEDGEAFYSDHVLLTAPLPQSLDLVQACAKDLHFSQLESALLSIQYDRCITLILELEQEVRMSSSGIWKFPHPSLDGIFNQIEKGVESDAPVLVVQASPRFSEKHWDDETKTLEELLELETRNCLSERGLSFQVKSKLIHKWKYSMPRTYYPSPFACLSSGKNKFVLAGDAFQHSSVEGAISSGLAAAEFLLEN